MSNAPKLADMLFGEGSSAKLEENLRAREYASRARDELEVWTRFVMGALASRGMGDALSVAEELLERWRAKREELWKRHGAELEDSRKAMQRAADEARADERRMILNYLRSLGMAEVKIPTAVSRDILNNIEAGKHLETPDPR